MNEDELRQACKVTRQRMNRCVNIDDTINVLLAFARRMQAAGVQMAGKELEKKSEDWDYHDGINNYLDWCEAEAKRMEGK